MLRIEPIVSLQESSDRKPYLVFTPFLIYE